MPVTAADRGYTYTEAWRHQCEVEFVCDMPAKQRRADYLDGVEKRRGPEAGAKLRADVKARWAARRSGEKFPAPLGTAKARALRRSVHLGSMAPAPVRCRVQGPSLQSSMRIIRTPLVL